MIFLKAFCCMLAISKHVRIYLKKMFDVAVFQLLEPLNLLVTSGNHQLELTEFGLIYIYPLALTRLTFYENAAFHACYSDSTVFCIDICSFIIYLYFD